MTTFRSLKTVCGNCKQESVQTILTSTNAFGAPDLDGRPAPMRRNTMNMWLQECPHCRLVCERIDAPPTGASEIVAEPEYLALVNDGTADDALRKFRSWAYLASALNLASEEAFAHLHLAWLADDQNDPALARTERTSAVEKFGLLRDEGRLYPNQPGAAEVLLADLWRRTGQFDNAIHESSRCASIAKQGRLIKICALQTALAKRGDANVHTIDEAQAGRLPAEDDLRNLAVAGAKVLGKPKGGTWLRRLFGNS